MEVFISWSGPRSKAVAIALREWLPLVTQGVIPWMSQEDIEAGQRWEQELSERLEKTNYGIICCTADNLNARWLHFEAGALAKKVNASRVCPYLIGINRADVSPGPLSIFQMKLANKNDTYDIVKGINKLRGELALKDEQLKETFEMWWPKLSKSLENLPAVDGEQEPKREDREILEEVLNIVRGLVRLTLKRDSVLEDIITQVSENRRDRALGLQGFLGRDVRDILDMKLSDIAAKPEIGEGAITTGRPLPPEEFRKGQR